MRSMGAALILIAAPLVVAFSSFPADPAATPLLCSQTVPTINLEATRAAVGAEDCDLSKTELTSLFSQVPTDGVASIPDCVNDMIQQDGVLVLMCQAFPMYESGACSADGPAFLEAAIAILTFEGFQAFAENFASCPES